MTPQQIGTLAVAVLFVALALPDGGYSLELQAAMTVGMWSLLLAGLVSRALPRAAIPRTALVAGALLALLALLTLCSVAWASDDGAAYAEGLRVCGYLGLFAFVVCVSPEGSARYWLIGLGLGIVILAALATGSRLVPVLPGDDSEVAELLPASNGRLSYPIGYWNGLGAVVALGAVLTGWLAANGDERLQRALATAALPLLGLTLYLTSSRGGVAALTVGVAALLVLGPARFRTFAALAIGGAATALPVFVASRRTELLDGVETSTSESQGLEVLAVTLLAMGLAFALAWYLDDRLARAGRPLSPGKRRAAMVTGLVVAVVAIVAVNPSQRWQEFKEVPDPEQVRSDGFVAGHFSSGAGSGRYQFWEQALEASGEEPVHGIGAGGYEAYWSMNASINQRAKNAHSLYLETLAELGPLGLILVLGFIGVGAFAGIAAMRERVQPEAAAGLALLAAGAVSAGVDLSWEIPAVFAPMVLVVALLTGPARPRKMGLREGAAGFGWAVAAVAVGSVSIVLAADVFLTERSIAESRAAAERSEYDDAVDAAADAVALQPWAAEPRLQLALVLEAGGGAEDAVEAVSEATDRAPDDWRLWVARARIETRSGDVDGGRLALSRARSLYPRSPLFAPAPPPATP